MQFRHGVFGQRDGPSAARRGSCSLSSAMFSERRAAQPSAESHHAGACAARARPARRFVDLTTTNPTTVGIDYPPSL